MLEPDRTRTVVHMDLDSFFVSVECLRNSALKGLPLIIGGSSDRGVVASCSYEARKFGVRSAMAVRLARQLCPDVLVISGDMDAYSKYSQLITDIIASEAPLFEKSSIDEFYLDISGMDRFFGCYRWAGELRQKIMRESGLPISMGVSVNKLVSKVATGESKPNGARNIIRGMEQDFLAPLPITKIPMVGEKTSRFLFDMGIRTVKVLREMPVDMLQAALGKNGEALWKKAHAIDESPVLPYQDQKSISTELTFENDSIDVKMMQELLTAMAEKLAFKLRRKQKLCSCIAVKIRYANFDTESRQMHIPYTSSDKTLIRHAHELFEKLYQRRMLIRLIGIRLSGLVHGNYQISLFEDTEEMIRLYQAMDSMRIKHGAHAVARASGFKRSKRLDDLML
jgi:DNA polymerase-4